MPLYNLHKVLANKRIKDRLLLQAKTLLELKRVLKKMFHSRRVWVFGSLVKKGSFHAKSDIDLAIEALPEGISEYQVIALLEEQLRRPVDLVLINNCRFKNKILKEGRPWML